MMKSQNEVFIYEVPSNTAIVDKNDENYIIIT